ncbi:hypothetical protein [Flavobacterium sp. N2038]|uniref:hypothetical protein n=1 Tax=Flavobacterium sp. N2038 TaxID=2986829 RepID=UPI0022254079|nr:hypothetical protein [Flavobacterium sp. N2038]
MKKCYTKKDYRRYHKRKLKQKERAKRKRKKGNFKQKTSLKRMVPSFSKGFIKKKKYNFATYAPKDFRLIDNTESCLAFFREIRGKDSIIYSARNVKQVKISLKDVESIDYAAISALTAITDDLNSRGIDVQGDFPDNEKCRNYIIESGFLTNMVDLNNKKFPDYGKSKLIFFEKGSGKLSKTESKKISELIKDVVEHLTGTRKNIKPIKTVLLEICANSIEHANTIDKQWLLGVKFTDDKVYFTVTDVGKGILDTLYISNKALITNLLRFNSKLDVLKGAFLQKYGSSTQEENRNKGLPSVRVNFEQGILKNLIVLTNNVILHFGDLSKSATFRVGSSRFKGTLYQWEMNKECVINSINCDEQN